MRMAQGGSGGAGPFEFLSHCARSSASQLTIRAVSKKAELRTL